MNQHLTNSNFEPNLLHENSLGYISQCEECKEITVVIKSIMFFCSVKIHYFLINFLIPFKNCSIIAPAHP